MFLEGGGRMNKCLETLSVLASLTLPFLPTWCHTDYTFRALWGCFFVHLCVLYNVGLCVCERACTSMAYWEPVLEITEISGLSFFLAIARWLEIENGFL